jgi:endonuclease YncB( thermonuclease family)
MALRAVSLCFALLALLSPSHAAEILGKVVDITDGDTITVLDGGKVEHKIRLQSIDAPEIAQPYGPQAKEMLSARILDKDVKVVWFDRDRFGRPLGQLYLGKRWINHEQVADGAAWHFKRHSQDKCLTDAELAARAATAGLWANKEAQSPWDYRAMQRATAKAKKLVPLSVVHSAVVKRAVPQATTTVLHVCDWPLQSAKEFLARRRDKPPKAAEAVKLYQQHRVDVAAVQEEQTVLIRTILDNFSVVAVFQEGLTASDMEAYKLVAQMIKADTSAPKFGEPALRQGATGQLYREGKIKDLLPLDDAAALRAANPIADDGTLKADSSAVAKRTDAQVAALLKQPGIVVVVLDGAHDLTKHLTAADAKVEYLRIEVRAYKKLTVR